MAADELQVLHPVGGLSVTDELALNQELQNDGERPASTFFMTVPTGKEVEDAEIEHGDPVTGEERGGGGEGGDVLTRLISNVEVLKKP